MTDLAFARAVDLLRLYRARKASTLEVMQAVLARISQAGLPVGLQIVGKRRGEAVVLRAAAAFESVQPWTRHVPPVAQ